jgi:hypothetical protein
MEALTEEATMEALTEIESSSVTPPPEPTTAAPTPTVVTLVDEMQVKGKGFPALIDTPEKYAQLKQSLEKDLARVIGTTEVNVTDIKIANETHALTAVFEYNATGPAQQTRTKFEVVVNSGTLDWLNNTVTLYVTTTGDNDVKVVFVAGVAAESQKSEEPICGGKCFIGAVAGGCALFVVFVALLMYRRHTSHSLPPETPATSGHPPGHEPDTPMHAIVPTSPQASLGSPAMVSPQSPQPLLNKPGFHAV